jgi:hypothetical protein
MMSETHRIVIYKRTPLDAIKDTYVEDIYSQFISLSDLEIEKIIAYINRVKQENNND